MRLALLVPLCAALVSVPVLRLSAQGEPTEAAASAPAQAEVFDVKFDYPRAGYGDNWLETTVAIDVRPGGRAVSGEFLDRLRATLSLGCEASNPKGEKRTVFYRASAETIAVEGGRVFIRFYLPPEVVKRDRLRGDPTYYVVELDAAGQPQKPAAGAISAKSIPNARNFLDRVTTEAGRTQGVLMPQYLTPFANDPRRPTPTLLRPEVQR